MKAQGFYCKDCEYDAEVLTDEPVEGCPNCGSVNTIIRPLHYLEIPCSCGYTNRVIDSIMPDSYCLQVSGRMHCAKCHEYISLNSIRRAA